MDLEKVDAILVSEPNKKLTATSEWTTDKEEEATMLCVSNDIGVQKFKSEVGYVRCELEKYNIRKRRVSSS